MKKLILIAALILIGMSTEMQAQAQTDADKMKAEIRESLQQWNAAAKSGDVNRCMAMFDTTPDILMVGSDSGEIFKGPIEMREWLTALMEHANFSWEMNRVDIDYFENTAWVFIDGKMVVSFDNGKSRKNPYRFTGILIKKEGAWKWRLFNGSIPKGE